MIDLAAGHAGEDAAQLVERFLDVRRAVAAVVMHGHGHDLAGRDRLADARREAEDRLDLRLAARAAGGHLHADVALEHVLAEATLVVLVARRRLEARDLPERALDRDLMLAELVVAAAEDDLRVARAEEIVRERAERGLARAPKPPS